MTDAQGQPMRSLPTDTSTLAGQQAARSAGSWRRRILDAVRTRGPMALFEMAEFLAVPDHIISGRVTDLRRDGFLVATGDRRRKPATGCLADVYDLATAAAAPQADVGALLGYPDALRVGNDFYDRAPLLPSEGYPGIPYALRRDTGGGPRQLVRIELVECPGCGKRLSLRVDGTEKFLDCTGGCGQTWRLKVANVPGRAPTLALVMETFK